MNVQAQQVTSLSGSAQWFHRALGAGMVCVAAIRRVPFTLGLLGVIWLLAALSGSLGQGAPPDVLGRFGFAPVDLVNGRIISIVTSVVFIHKRFMVGPLNLSLLLFILPYEWIAGTRRVIAVFWGGHIIETAISAMVILLVAAAGIPSASVLASTHDVGMSSGTFACAGALVLVLPSRWRKVAAFALVAYLLGMVVFSHQVYDFDHLLVAPIGAAIGWLVGARGAPPSDRFEEYDESEIRVPAEGSPQRIGAVHDEPHPVDRG